MMKHAKQEMEGFIMGYARGLYEMYWAFALSFIGWMTILSIANDELHHGESPNLLL